MDLRQEAAAFPGLSAIPLGATHLRGQQWCVRPVGQLGTCGFSPVPWTAQFVRAKSAEEAIRKAKPILIVTSA